METYPGQQFVDGTVLEKFTKAYSTLSKREKEILPLIARGLNNEDIAEIFSLAPRTVDTFRSKIYGKLNIHSAAEIVRICSSMALRTPQGNPNIPQLSIDFNTDSLNSFENNFKSLTPREISIVSFLVDGYNEESIANNLYIARSTVATHRANIYKKLCVHSTKDLARFYTIMQERQRNNMINDIPEFGIKRENEERRDGGCGVVLDPKTGKYAVGKQMWGEGHFLRLFSGGIEEGEEIENGVMREIVEESGLHNFLYTEKIGEVVAHFRNSLKNVNRIAHATCFLVVLKDTDLVQTKLEAHEKFTLDWATPGEILKNWQERNANKDYDHWIYFFKKAVNRAIELGYDKINSKM